MSYLLSDEAKRTDKLDDNMIFVYIIDYAVSLKCVTKLQMVSSDMR